MYEKEVTDKELEKTLLSTRARKFALQREIVIGDRQVTDTLCVGF